MEEFIIKITITCKSDDISEIALDEVVKKLKEGYLSGFDGNEDESYTFSVKQNTTNN